MDAGEREWQVKTWLRLQYLKDIAKVQKNHAKYMPLAPGDIISSALSVEGIRDEIKKARHRLRMVSKPSFKRANESEICHAIKSLFDPSGTRRTGLSIKVGGGATSSSKYSGLIRVTVGHMWLHKVWKTIYVGNSTKGLGNLIVLSADKVRVNSKLIDLYEVKTMDSVSGDLVPGYVAVTKTTRRYATFGRNAQQAVKKGEEIVSRELDKIFTKTQERE